MSFRVKFSDVRQEKAEGSSNILRRIPIHRTQSFKGDKKGQSWLTRQFSRQMSRSNSGRLSSEDEISATAVAAAAFAIDSTFKDSTETSAYAIDRTFKDSTETTDKRSPSSITPHELSLNRTNSKKERPMTYGSSSEQGAFPSGLSGDHDSTLQGESTPETKPRRRPSLADQLADTLDSKTSNIEMPPTPPPQPPPPPPPLKPSQSIMKPADPPVQMNSENMEPERSLPKPSMPSAPSSKPQPKPASGPALRGGTKADVWEITEMEKIKERYDKLNATIDSWEESKKKKAKTKLEKTESELAKRRSKAMEKFREEMESIKQIAGGARSQAGQRKRNEELKATEKANKYRNTGKFPKTCFCF